MTFTHLPSHIAWKRTRGTLIDPLEMFSKETGKKIKKGLEIIKASPYHFDIEDVNDVLLGEFLPLYRKNIISKEGALVHDIKGYINQHSNIKIFKILVLRKNQIFTGGLIFSLNADTIAAAYKVFPKEINDLKLPISFSFLAEYYFYHYWLKQTDKTMLTHGRDRNLLGISSNPGLATYKLQVGCFPYVSSTNNLEWLDFTPPAQNKRDILIFHGEQPKEIIKKITLILYQTDPQNLAQKYGALYKINCKITILNRFNQPAVC